VVPPPGGGASLFGILEYSTELFERETLQRVAAQLIGILEFVQDPSRAAGARRPSAMCATRADDVASRAAGMQLTCAPSQFFSLAVSSRWTLSARSRSFVSRRE